VSSTARDAGIAGLEFLRSIPGTVGGFVRMNGGAYGGEVKDILVDCDVLLRDGSLQTLAGHRSALYLSPFRPAGRRDRRCRAVQAGVLANLRRSRPRWTGSPPAARPRQPLRSKTGGSTFKNPQGHKAWQLVDEAGCRGLTLGGAQVSEKHTNFLLNTGNATSTEIEALGEEVRRRVRDKSGVELEWEIQRVGTRVKAPDEEGVGNK
jgi:UDP-N-acetylmuramate dehydrogenase